MILIAIDKGTSFLWEQSSWQQEQLHVREQCHHSFKFKINKDDVDIYSN